MTAPPGSVAEVIDLAAQPATPVSLARIGAGIVSRNDRVAMACNSVAWALGRGEPVDFAALRFLAEGEHDRRH